MTYLPIEPMYPPRGHLYLPVYKLIQLLSLPDEELPIADYTSIYQKLENYNDCRNLVISGEIGVSACELVIDKIIENLRNLKFNDCKQFSDMLSSIDFDDNVDAEMTTLPEIDKGIITQLKRKTAVFKSNQPKTVAKVSTILPVTKVSNTREEKCVIQ